MPLRLTFLLAVLVVALARAAAPPDAFSAPEPTPAATPGPSEAMVYTCAMHPEVKSPVPGVCSFCGMPLVSMAALRDAVDYGLQLDQDPVPAKPGETVRLRFRFFHPVTGAPIREFQVVHGKSFHLFVVSRDLQFYEHIHPKLEADGSFTIETSVPESKAYEIFCDVFPVGGAPRVIRRSLAVADVPAGGEAHATAARGGRRSRQGRRRHPVLDDHLPSAARSRSADAVHLRSRGRGDGPAGDGSRALSRCLGARRLTPR